MENVTKIYLLILNSLGRSAIDDFCTLQILTIDHTFFFRFSKFFFYLHGIFTCKVVMFVLGYYNFFLLFSTLFDLQIFFFAVTLPRKRRFGYDIYITLFFSFLFFYIFVLHLIQPQKCIQMIEKQDDMMDLQWNSFLHLLHGNVVYILVFVFMCLIVAHLDFMSNNKTFHF